jgi:hypothetical protein
MLLKPVIDIKNFDLEASDKTIINTQYKKNKSRLII